jgi:hypothetical protein
MPYLLLFVLFCLSGCKQKPTPKQEVLHIEQEQLLFFPTNGQYINLRTLEKVSTPISESQNITLQPKNRWQYELKMYEVVHQGGYKYTSTNSITPQIEKQGDALTDSLTDDVTNFFLKNDSGVIWIHDIPHETFTDVILFDSAGHKLWHTVVETKDTSGQKILQFRTYTGAAIIFGSSSKTVFIHTANGSKKNLDIHTGGVITDLDGITIIGVLPIDSGAIHRISYFAEDFKLANIKSKFTSAATASNNSQYFVLLYNIGKSEAQLQTYNLFNNTLSWESKIAIDGSINKARLLSYEKKIIVEIQSENSSTCKIYNVTDGKVLYE